MPGVGEEASGVCQHADKAGEVSEVCEGDHLILHAGLVIVEPPCAALLDLRARRGILETAEDRADRLVVVRVQAVDDRLWQLVRADECVQEIGKLGRRSVIVDAVVAGVGT